MIGSGVFEFEIDGRKIGFEFGMLASAYTEEVSKLSIYEVFKKMASGKSQISILHYFYGGAVAYNEFRNIDENVTVAKVSKYIEAIGLRAAMDVYVKSIESYLPKNGKAPKKAGLEV